MTPPDPGEPDAGAGATPAGPFAGLLEVQDHDTVVDQLRHRRLTLPERAELARIDQRRGELDAQTKEVGAERDELGARQATLEQQIDASRARRAELEKKMYGGQESDACGRSGP